MGRRLLTSLVAFAMILWSVPLASQPALAVSPDLVISQVYGGGGNTGAPYLNDFIEIFNRGTTPVSLTGRSVQYTSATGTGVLGASGLLTVLPAVSLNPGQYFLVQQASGGTNGVALPTADAVGPTNMSATGGKVALVNSTTSLGCNGGSTPCDAAQVALIIDLIGYGTANFFETAPAPTLTNTTSAQRDSGGCVDTDNNAADFSAAAPAPRNSASPLNFCSGDAPPSVISTMPAGGATSVAVTTSITITFDEPVVASASSFSITCTTSGAHAATLGGGPMTFTLDPTTDFASGETCTVAALAAAISDADALDPPDNPLADFTFSFATAFTGHLVISQVYGGGGNSGATYKNDFIELYNPTTATFDVTGWSVQYTSATGTTWAVTPLTGAIAPGRYYLIQEAAGAGGTADLPTPHVRGTIAMGATAGKVALRDTTTAFTGCPIGAIDLVGYGTTATCFEGTGPTGTLSNTTAALRAGAGAQDTDDNASDFTVGAPNPRATADHVIGIQSVTPIGAAIPVTTNITITFTESATVTGAWYTITCSVSGAHTASVSGGPLTFTLDPDTDFIGGDSCTVVVLAANVTDQDADDPPDQMLSNFQFSFLTQAPATFIHEIQGATHISPKNGMLVGGVPGIVTTKTSNGFWMQDPAPDADPATSEGLFVFTSTAPAVNVGDAVTVAGRVTEFRPGSAGLTITELTGPSISIVSTGNPLPPAIAIGAGRMPPTEVIEDDASPDVETSNVFDPASDGIDFWESLEGMRVDLGPVVITGPSPFDEIGVLANNGAGATSRTARGGIVISATDKNPEKVLLRGIGFDMPDSNTGDHFAGPIVGVVGYAFNNFMVEVPVAPTRIADGVTREVTTEPGPGQLTIATFNVENLDPGDASFATLASLIVNNLRSPDIISLEEIQDNDGPANTTVVSADVTLTRLRDAVVAAGGPTYDWRLIDPVDDQDGGEPGGNIRQAFFFRTDRGLTFVDRPGAGSTTANAVVNNGGEAQLQFSPGRLDPTNPAFTTSRKPLAAEFTYNGHRIIAVANHWNSKGGDDPLWGHRQPPILSSEAQRVAQATVVRDFVQQILAIDASANVVVLGDLNDFEWSAPLMTLKSAPMYDLIETLPANERYTYVFDGNSQTLDHILVSNALLGLSTTDVVHVNAEFHDQASDHDPLVATITLADTTAPTITVTQAPAPNANGWNNTDVTVTFTCADDVGILSCLGSTTLTAETAGTLVTGTATDTSGNTATVSTTVRIDKTAPTFTWSGPTTYAIDDTLALDCAIVETLSGVDPAIPSFCEDAAGPASALGPGTHTLMAAATDRAGNSGTATFTFTITIDHTSLCGLVRELVTDEDVADSLCNKLAAAAASLARGHISAHDSQMRAFANQVEAQRGKTISDADADLLLELAALL